MKKTDRKRLGIRKETIRELSEFERNGIRGAVITYTQTNEDCTTVPGGGGGTDSCIPGCTWKCNP